MVKNYVSLSFCIFCLCWLIDNVLATAAPTLAPTTKTPTTNTPTLLPTVMPTASPTDRPQDLWWLGIVIPFSVIGILMLVLVLCRGIDECQKDCREMQLRQAKAAKDNNARVEQQRLI